MADWMWIVIGVVVALALVLGWVAGRHRRNRAHLELAAQVRAAEAERDRRESQGDPNASLIAPVGTGEPRHVWRGDLSGGRGSGSDDLPPDGAGVAAPGGGEGHSVETPPGDFTAPVSQDDPKLPEDAVIRKEPGR